MRVTVKKDPNTEDFLIVTLQYKVGNRVMNMHNDTWLDIKEALEKYWLDDKGCEVHSEILDGTCMNCGEVVE